MSRIPLLVPQMPTTDSLLPYLRSIDENRKYTNFGPLNAQFEARLVQDAASHLSASNVTTVSNCTAGLELALQALALRAGARVLIPAITFVATATAVVRVGMVPVIADVDRDNWLLTPAIAYAACENLRIDAVMPVATFGCPHDPVEWDAFTSKTGIPVVIDAAGAYGNQKVGTTTDVVFSFHATKSFGAAEGGAVFSSNTDRIKTIRQLANFGIDTSISQLCGFGTNAKMSEYHCAIGLATFDKWDAIKRSRQELSARYVGMLGLNCPTVTLQRKPEEGIYPLMPVLLPPGIKADAIASILAAKQIETRRWYSPGLHLHPALAATPKAGQLKVSDDIGERILGLPFFIGLSEQNLVRVIHEVGEALRNPTGKIA